MICLDDKKVFIIDIGKSLFIEKCIINNMYYVMSINLPSSLSLREKYKELCVQIM